MPSHASQAAGSLQKDQARRLTIVPDPAPPMSKGDAARKAARDALPPHQQAVYDQVMADGGRHVTALGRARKVPEPDTTEQPAAGRTDVPVTPDPVTAPDPDPDPDPDPAGASVEEMAASMFAAFQTGLGGAAAPADSLTATVAAQQQDSPPEPSAAPPAPPTPKPVVPVPVPVPAAAQPAPKPAPPKPASPKPAPAPRPAAPPDGSCQRYIGTVTATTLDGKETVHDCEHASRNGHMDVSTAETCAKRLLRNHPGTPGTRVHPVRRDRTGRRLS